MPTNHDHPILLETVSWLNFIDPQSVPLLDDEFQVMGHVLDRPVHHLAHSLFAPITDDRPDEPRGRPHVAIGTEIEIPNNKLKWDKSNPTGHGIVFLSRGGYVFCYVQPGGV